MKTDNVSALRPAAGTVLPPNEACAALQRRLRAETRGEVLFDAASRGRYATDASIYQIMPVGVFVPETAEDIATALAIARETERAGAAARRRHQPVRPDRGRGAGHRLQQAPAPRARRSTSPSAHGHGGARPGARPPERAAQGPRPVVPGGRVHQRAGHAGRHGRQQQLRQPLASPTATWCTTWPAPGLAGRRQPARLRPGGAAERPRAAASADFVRGLAEQHRAEIEARWPKVLRRVAGYNLDIFHPQSEKPYTADGSVNLAHLLVGAKARWPSRAA